MRSPARLLFAFVIVVVVAALPAASRAAEVSGPDQETIRSIIGDQIEAFRRDDGDAAYGHASPMIRNLFPTVDQFMAMVRNGYMPVCRPRSVTFGQIADLPGGPLQKVFLTGPDGRGWVAVYSLQRQPDGTWKINGVRLVEDDGATI